MTVPHPSRRAFLGGSVAVAAWAMQPRIGFAGTRRDPRLVVILLRGALDGLGAVAPVFDPDYERQRGDLVLAASGRPSPKLPGGFELNPNLAAFAGMFSAGEASVVHAVCTPYRARSHFDGQDVLESGLPGVATTVDGWLARAVAALPKGEAVAGRPAFSYGATVPLILRGDVPVSTIVPKGLDDTDADTARRLLALYKASDPGLASVLAEAAPLDKEAAAIMAAGHDMGGAAGGGDLGAGLRMLARSLTAPDGARVAVIDAGGWDTHSNEAPVTGGLGKRLAMLDAALAGFRTAMAGDWRETVVVIATEFGRTARVNGSDGTDHGTGTVAFLAGGAVRGGRVVADWPGLSDKALLDGRDLAPTTDLRAVLKGVLADHLGLSDRVLAETVFPQSAAVKPMRDLLA